MTESVRVADRYSLLRELGRGGMGVVWLAADEFLGRQVAVKELRPPRWLTGDELQTHQRRALQEARSAARIHHPNAVTLYEAIPAGEQDAAVYLIMELVEGPTLAQLVTRQGPLPAPRVAAFALQLLDVLEMAHALGIVHRDVKPGNILIAANDQVKLTDFGIAYTMGEARLTRTGVMGTQAYQAPELFESAPITPAVDLWSLGATLYCAADGRGPFDRDSTGATLRAIVLDDLPVPHCEEHLAAVIMHMLRRDPAERATIDQARAGLRQVPAQASPPPAEPGRSEPITIPASGPPSPDREPRWNPDDVTGLRADAPPRLHPTREVPVKRAPGRRYLSRKGILIATVAVVAAGGAFGLLAAAGVIGGHGAPEAIHSLNPTITTTPSLTVTGSPTATPSPRPGPAPARVPALSPVSEDTTGKMVVFVNGSKQIVADSYSFGWQRPRVLPGTARPGSPIVVSPSGTSVYFIEPNGVVAHDYVSGSRWEGPGQTGGVAEAGSGLAFYQGNGAGTHPAVVFAEATGRLAYDYYDASGWQGPVSLPGTPRAGSSSVISPYMQNIVFIEPNGDVANDYVSGSRWKGPVRIGGVAHTGSALAFSPGSRTAGTHPAVAFVNAGGKLVVYDYYGSGWHGPVSLPGTPRTGSARAGSPVAWSGDGTSVYFIKSDGKVATDYLSGARWQGPKLTGGGATRDSALIYAPGNGTAADRANVVFVAADGRLFYDWYGTVWHGPYPLPGAVQSPRVSS